jgi:integrase
MEAAESWEDEREGTLVLLLLMHGLKVSEAINLTTKDLRVDGGHLKIMITRKGMGGKTAVLVDDDHLRRRLDRILATNDGAVFGSLDRFGAVRSVASIGRVAGLEPVPHPHILRHTFVAQALRLGNSIEEFRRMAGHSSIRITQR